MGLSGELLVDDCLAFVDFLSRSVEDGLEDVLLSRAALTLRR